MPYKEMSRDGLWALLRFGRKNSGPWDEFDDAEWLPDDRDVDRLVADLRDVGDLRIEVRQLQALAADAHKAWDRDKDARVGKLLTAMLDPEFRKGYRPDLYKAERQEKP